MSDLRPAPIEGVVTTGGPTCAMHSRPGGSHLPSGPVPAHTWGSSRPGSCQRCPEPVVAKDLYVCVPGGIAHLACPGPVNAAGIDRLRATPEESR